MVPARIIFLEPNAIDRVFELLEENVAIVKSKPLKSNFPAVSVTTAVPGVVHVKTSARVVVCPAISWYMFKPRNGLPLGVITPVLVVKIVNPLYVPLDESVMDPTYKAVLARVNAVVPKFNVLKQPLLVSV